MVPDASALSGIHTEGQTPAGLGQQSRWPPSCPGPSPARPLLEVCSARHDSALDQKSPGCSCSDWVKHFPGAKMNPLELAFDASGFRTHRFSLHIREHTLARINICMHIWIYTCTHAHIHRYI